MSLRELLSDSLNQQFTSVWHLFNSTFYFRTRKEVKTFKRMEKVVWDNLIAPGLREQLVKRYVPKEPVDPLVYKLTAFYWLLQELIGNWKSGKRLTMDQKTQLIQLLVWNLSRVQDEQAAYDEYESYVMIPGIEAFTEDKIRRQGFDNPREPIPHAVDVHNVALCETSDEEEYDTAVSSETTEQIAQLVLACKEFQLKVPENLGKSQACEVD
jgi:hypothetical protein